MIRERSRLPPWAEQARFGGPISLDWPIFGTLSTAAGFAEAVNRAADYVALHGAGEGNTIYIPAGTYECASTYLMIDSHTITGITQANPGVVSHTGTAAANGDVVMISGNNGMTEVCSRLFIVANAGAGTFELTDMDGQNVDTSGYTAYVSAGKWRKRTTSAAEGATIFLTPEHSNIVWQGAGRGLTIIKPSSNKIEIFANIGAENMTFRGITFDNRVNGVLQNQVKASKFPGAGGAVGNAANAAIRQYVGADMLAEDCEFLEWHTCVNYIGDDDDQVLVGTVEFSRNRCDGCVFGLLTSQPKYVVCNNNEWLNGIDSNLSTGKRDPGHLLYISNTHGVHPHTVTANDNYADTHSSSVLKLRKGLTQICVGNCFYNVHRGIESHNAYMTTIMGGTIKLGRVAVTPSGDPSDFNQAALTISACPGGGQVSGVTIDRSGCYGYAIRIRPQDIEEDDSGDPLANENPRNLVVKDITIIDDLSLNTGAPDFFTFRPFISVRGATDCTIEDITLRIKGNITCDETVVDADNCTRLRVSNIRRYADDVGNPTGSDKLVHLGGPDTQTFTVTIASPAVITCVGHGFFTDTPFVPSTDGALPTGMTAATTYYAIPVDEDHFQFAATPGGAAINTTGSQSGTHSLTTAGCIDCTVMWNRQCLGSGVAPTSSTISDSGTNTTILRTDGEISKTWTPVVTFDTADDFDPTYTTQNGWYKRTGDMVTVGCAVGFSTNAYVTTAGGLRIAGLPFAARTYGTPFSGAVGYHKQIGVSGGADLGVRLADGATYFTARRNTQAGDGTSLDITHFPASSAGFEMAFQISFRITET